MSLFSELEKTIERGFHRFAERMFGAADSNELLLLHRAILAEVEGKVQIVARGRRVFPFARVVVTLVAAEAERRTILQAAFGERLGADIREAMDGSECELPRGFSLEVRTAEAGLRAFEIAYSVEPVKTEAVAAAAGRVILVKGKTEHPEYTLERARTNIGRMPELTDADHRVVRRNDVVFEEGADEANATVSRKHAHIRLDSGDYRLCDDGSEFGTRVFRDGRSIEVPAGDRRGEKLRPGDEVYLGRACLRFER
ncbi:MAG: FHA domain-containing protein [Candidatus Solibacter sp.]|nr:FHA domain-containing protein [Candidatus Solibacter sp.]